MYGGRKEAMLLHYKIQEGKTIQYLDVMSLYRFICKYFKFTIGHHVIHVEYACQHMEAMLQKGGLIMFSILPSKHLYKPVLPFRCKTTYSVCVGPVSLSKIEPRLAHIRQLLKGHWQEPGWWMKLGWLFKKDTNLYRCTKCTNIKWQHDPQTGNGELFAQYIDTFSKLKSEASGYPDCVHCPEDEDRYVSDFD